MSLLDWVVLAGSLIFIAAYGSYRTRKQRDMQSFLLADKSLPWYTVGISIMATQASAITFLSAPGQAFDDGMRFIQFYFGLPLAMVLLCIVVLPIYHRLKVYTAYEYLESRYDFKTRALAAVLFLIQRGLAAGLTIYAPSIILSSLMGWNIYVTTLLIGGLVVVYTTVGGSAAVGQTHKQQMAIILTGMLVAAWYVVSTLPADISFGDALHLSGAMGKLQTIDLSFDPNDKYTLWSGVLGGFFLMLSYFGTDQSQVQRYLSAGSLTQSRLGLLFNGLLKIPMQFCILLIGALLAVWYLFTPPPLFFNDTVKQSMLSTDHAAEWAHLELEHTQLWVSRKKAALQANEARKSNNTSAYLLSKEVLAEKEVAFQHNREKVRDLIRSESPTLSASDTNYVFLHFVIHTLPAGLVGLLIAAIFAASMSSTSSELNALATTTMVDLYLRKWSPNATPRMQLLMSRLFTVAWGLYAIGLAMFAGKLGSLIEAVNVLGSLFYGTILGIFLCAFFVRPSSGSSVFVAALLAEGVVLCLYFFSSIGYLWFNLIGCLLVLLLSLVFYFILKHSKSADS